MKNFLNRYGLILFFPLTYLLSWWSAPLMNGGLIPQGPALAAIILIALTMGRVGLREYWKRVMQWRAGWWYLIAPLIVFGYTGIAFIISLLSGAKLVEMPHWLSTGVFIQLLLFGGQWEELGWTGYALPKLREWFTNHPNGPLLSTLVLAVFRMIWHLPLFLYGKMYWFDMVVLSFAFQIIIAWVYDRSDRSVPAVMALHFMSNIMGAILSPVFVGADRMLYYMLFTSFASLFAVMLVVSSQFKARQEKALAVS
jgi:hypothetical protein